MKALKLSYWLNKAAIEYGCSSFEDLANNSSKLAKSIRVDIEPKYYTLATLSMMVLWGVSLLVMCLFWCV